MATPPSFQDAMRAALVKLVDGDQTKSRVVDLLNQHIIALTLIATARTNWKVRSNMLGQAEDELIGFLEALSDTEHDGQEHAEQPADAQAPTVADLPEISPSEPELPEIPSSEPDLPEIPPALPEHQVQQSRKKKR